MSYQALSVSISSRLAAKKSKENTMSIGLIIIDIQNDYFPNGKMELEGSEQATQIAGRMLSFFRLRKLPVFHIQHIATGSSASFFLPGSTGAEIHQSVKPLDGESIIQKHFPNSFRETSLFPQLQQQNIQQLLVAGMMTHMCVDATTRAATDYGYECLIAQDACATRGLEFGSRTVSAMDVHTSFLAALDGTYGRVLSAEEILSEAEKGL
jgi:nicotinamidase-related amidase